MVFGAMASPLVAEAQQQAPCISTSGVGTVRVKPDTARIIFSVAKRASTVAAVRAENVESTASVTAALDALHITGMKSKTSAVQIRILWKDYDRGLEPQGYEMTNSFTALLTGPDVDKLAKDTARVVDAALESGANAIQEVSFFKVDDSAERRECLKQAYADARKNAEALAAASGAKIIGIQSISGSPQYGYYGGSYGAMGETGVQGSVGPSGEPSSYQPGETEIRCNANVSFKIE